MRLKQLKTYDYQLVNEEKKHLTSGLDGYCVIDNLVGVYGSLIKGLDTKEKIIQLCKDYYLTYNKSNFDPKDGISSSCIDHICEKYQIAHYAYDITNKCFMKRISKNSPPMPKTIIAK